MHTNTTGNESGCRLCGLPLAGNPHRLTVGGKVLSFCCQGCLHVYQILAASKGPEADFRHTDLFRDCQAAGMIGSGPAAATRNRKTAAETPHASEATWRLDGMWCPSCAWVIEEILRRTSGVLSAQVDFFSDLLHVRYLPHLVGEEQIGNRLVSLGYRLLHIDDPLADSGRQLLLRLGVAAILSVNIMMLSFALYGGFFQDLDHLGRKTLSLPLLLLTTPVLFYSGRPILSRGWRGLVTRTYSMDSIIAVGALAAYGYSVQQMWLGSLHLYFDTAAMLITLVLLGRFIEHRARAGLSPGLQKLQQLAAGKVRLWRNGRPRWVAVSTLRGGERLLVEAGEHLAVDGRIVEGRGEVDEAILTGEARPRIKKVGEEVLAGSLLLHGRLILDTTRVGAASTLGRMNAMVRQALQGKNRLEQLTDRISRGFVPFVLLTAVVTCALLLVNGHDTAEALLRGLTVLVISCPCALGIATPLAKMAIIGRARERGIIIRNPAAFEGAGDLDTLVFDKTGTVTKGHFILRAIHAPDCEKAKVLQRAAAVEHGAEHYLARELRRQAALTGPSPQPAAGCTLHAGLGVSGLVDGELTAIGNRALMARFGLQISPALEEKATAEEEHGNSVVLLGWQDSVRALFVFGDCIRAGMEELLAGLRAEGFALHLLSGDSAATTSMVAERLHIGNRAGQCRPEDKVQYIRALQAAGGRVAMIGDGINDSGALSVADIGIAVGGSPARLMEEGADVTLLQEPGGRLPEMFHLSHSMVTAIRQNLTFAFLYNAIAIPLAIAGLLNPLIAVCAMFASSLTVLGNTIRHAARTGERVEESGRKESVECGVTGVELSEEY